MSDSGKIGELMSWRMMDVVWNGSYILFVMINMVRISWRLACMVFCTSPICDIHYRILPEETCKTKSPHA